MIHRLLHLPLLTGIVLAAQTGPAVKPTEAPAAAVPEAPAQDVAIIKITPYKPTIQRDPFATPRGISFTTFLAMPSWCTTSTTSSLGL